MAVREESACCKGGSLVKVVVDMDMRNSRVMPYFYPHYYVSACVVLMYELLLMVREVTK